MKQIPTSKHTIIEWKKWSMDIGDKRVEELRQVSECNNRNRERSYISSPISKQVGEGEEDDEEEARVMWTVCKDSKTGRLFYKNACSGEISWGPIPRSKGKIQNVCFAPVKKTMK